MLGDKGWLGTMASFLKNLWQGFQTSPSGMTMGCDWVEMSEAANSITEESPRRSLRAHVLQWLPCITPNSLLIPVLLYSPLHFTLQVAEIQPHIPRSWVPGNKANECKCPEPKGTFSPFHTGQSCEVYPESPVSILLLWIFPPNQFTDPTFTEGLFPELHTS